MLNYTALNNYDRYKLLGDFKASAGYCSEKNNLLWYEGRACNLYHCRTPMPDLNCNFVKEWISNNIPWFTYVITYLSPNSDAGLVNLC